MILLLFNSIFKSNKRKSHDNEIKDMSHKHRHPQLPIVVIFGQFYDPFSTSTHHLDPPAPHFRSFYIFVDEPERSTDMH